MQSNIQEITDVFGPLITKVSREVAYEFKAKMGQNGYGYFVATPEDIEQRVYLKLAESNVTLSQFTEKDAPQSSIRLYARNAAMREVEARHRKSDGRGLGHREQSADCSPGALSGDAASPLTVAVNRSPSSSDLPLGALLKSELEDAVDLLAADILSKVPTAKVEALTAWVLDGLSAPEVADRVGTTYGQARNLISEGQKALHPEEVAALHGIRAFRHPEAKRPKPNGAPATALMDLLS